MKKTFIITWLIGIALTGCDLLSSDDGLGEDISDVEESDKVEGEFIQDVDKGENRLKYVLQEKEHGSDGNKILEYTIQNIQEDAMTLHFDTSMKYDYYILNGNGKTVYRESDEKVYSQSWEELVLEPGKKERNELKLPKLGEGKYTLVLTPAQDDFSDAEAVMKFEI